MLYALPAQSHPERFAGIAVVAGIHVLIVIGLAAQFIAPPTVPKIPDITVFPPEPKPIPIPTAAPVRPTHLSEPPVEQFPIPEVTITPEPPTLIAPPVPGNPGIPDSGIHTGAQQTGIGKGAEVGIACPNSQAVRESVRYPARLRLDGIQGDVVARFVVGTSGQIRDIAIVQSSHRLFSSAAIAAVREFQCVAQARDVLVEVPFSFRLN